MRKLVSILMAALLCFVCSAACSESSNYENMSFAELAALKKAVDNAYFSRAEAEPRILNKGNYVIGEDLPAGAYYFRVNKANIDSNNGSYQIYPSKEDYYNHVTKGALEGHVYYGGIGSYNFTNGQVLRITGADMLFGLSEESINNYPAYEPPEGTRVQPGIYVVGEDLPEGSYIVYAASLKSAYFAIYVDETWAKSQYLSPDKSYRVTVDEEKRGVSIVLYNDQAIKISDDDVIMKKVKTNQLVFD